MSCPHPDSSDLRGRGGMPARLLSVVLPTHNRPEQLERAARSVLDQRGGEMELVIVDDASDPATGDMVDRLAGDPGSGRCATRRRSGPAAVATAASPPPAATCWASVTTTTPGCRSGGDGPRTPGHRHRRRRGDVVAPGGPRPHRTDGAVPGATGLPGPPALVVDFVAIPFGVIRRSMFPDDLAIDVDLRTGEDWTCGCAAPRSGRS